MSQSKSDDLIAGRPMNFDIFGRYGPAGIDTDSLDEKDLAALANISRKACSTATQRALAAIWALERNLSLDGANLRNARFARQSLAEPQFAGAYLDGAIFDGARITDANFEKAALVGSLFIGSNIEQSYFGGADMEGSRLSGAAAAGSNFENANLRRCNFERCELVGARFDGSILTGARFDRSDLRGASFRNCIIDRTSFKGADLTDAKFGPVKLLPVRATDASGHEYFAWTSALGGMVITCHGPAPISWSSRPGISAIQKAREYYSGSDRFTASAEALRIIDHIEAAWREHTSGEDCSRPVSHEDLGGHGNDFAYAANATETEGGAS